MKKKMIGFCVVLFLTGGCATVPEKVKVLEAQTADLSLRLKESNAHLVTLEKENLELKAALQQQLNIAKALGKEKAVHLSTIGDLRQNIRTLLAAQMGFLREFSQKAELHDYVGGELIIRQYLEGNGLTLLDLKNTIPSGGSIFGTWGYFTSPCSYVVSILRKVNEKWFVVWQSDTVEVVKTNLQTFDFLAPVSVEKGDVMAYTFRGIVGVTFDRGTGETLYAEKALRTGGAVERSDFKGGGDKRTYSLGVVGIFG